MKKVEFFSIFVILMALGNSAAALEIMVGDLFHVTGCENGELVVPVINMWSKPGGIGAGARVVGKLSGDGRGDQKSKCQGAIVELLEITNVNGRVFLKVKPVVNSESGWITDSFVGKNVKKENN